MFGAKPSPAVRYTSLSATDTESEPYEKTFPERPGAFRRSWLIILFSTLVSLQFLGLYILHHEIKHSQTSSLLPRSAVPELPAEVKAFHRGPVYFNRSSPKTDAAWAALAGPSSSPHGFVNIPDYESYGLQGGATIGEKVVYSVSMFHQLHCLARVRKMLWDLADGTVDGAEYVGLTPNDTSSNFQGGPRHGFWEVQHCMDYLRQAIQCAGDMTLEWPIEADGKTLFVGWDTLHQCRSHDAARSFVDQHA